MAYFNDSIFRTDRFWEGLERVLGVCSRAKEGPKGGPGKIFKFTLGSKGGPKTKKDPRQTTGRPKTEAEGPWENNYQRLTETNRSKNANPLSRPGPLARRIFLYNAKPSFEIAKWKSKRAAHKSKRAARKTPGPPPLSQGKD